MAISTAGSARGQTLPWETWRDLHQLPVLHTEHQALLRSSHCPDGCRFDRHSEDDWRYLYVDGEEGTIFEESGPGAVTRIWMTTGFAGVSTPLPADVRLRVYLDGSEEPVIDVPLPALFDGSTPPFEAPLVGNRLTSSGGNFSYVPIPYRTGCRITLVGADEIRLWYQINFHRVPRADGITTFTGTEDLSPLTTLLSTQGEDPWPPDSGTVATGSLTLEPGIEQMLRDAEGHGSITALELELPPGDWAQVEMRLHFDDQPTVAMRLEEFFAIGRGGPKPTCSLLIGAGGSGRLYSYFPMPFFKSHRIALVHHGKTSTAMSYRIRVDADAPPPNSGLFGAVLSRREPTDLGVDFPVATLAGHGKLVGSFLELGATNPGLRDYLEGDERLFLDHSPHPMVYGTGVEDYFNGGFYFDMGPFSSALHGAPYTELEVDGLPYTASYRLMLAEGQNFESRLQAGLESGPTNNVSMVARSVTWFYLQPSPRLHLWDRLDLGREEDRRRHRYLVEGPHAFQLLDALFASEPPVAASGTGVYRPLGDARFDLSAHPSSTTFRLRRRLDAGIPGQRATVRVDGEIAGRFPAGYRNEDRRWRDVAIDLDAAPESGELAITVVAEPGPPEGESSTFTAFHYELWANGAAAIFADGFETGDLRAWSSSP
ncbi:MAG: DUF2961 domain-containing protein [Acidobacteriota bacterium]